MDYDYKKYISELTEIFNSFSNDDLSMHQIVVLEEKIHPIFDCLVECLEHILYDRFGLLTACLKKE